MDGKPIDRYWYDALQRLADTTVTETRVAEIVQAQTPPPAASATTITPTAGIDVAGNATDGYYIGLRALFDTGVGAALWKFTRDAFGRVEGTEAATTDDLAEGATNLYHTPERVRDVMALALLPGSGITVTVDDPGDTITIAATGGSGSGAGEILIQDGSSAPPVMLTNEAEDDFIYAD